MCPRENQARGDTAQFTDFAQTWHKFWVWQVTDCAKKVSQTWPSVANLCIFI